MTVLVTGGAGYIGAHVVRLLADAGAPVVVVDDLSTSSAARVGDVPLEVFDISAPGGDERLADVMRTHAVEAVIHFAAKKQVGESVADPLLYYRQNTAGMIHLLTAQQAVGVDRIIFSSSATLYGVTDLPTLGEDLPAQPINPYGRTKRIGEWMMEDSERAWGLRWASLRYFNVAGSGWSELGDGAIMNLIPMVFDRLARGERPRLFGEDYPTPDGTCIRDYVHVLDLARAHIAALDALAGDGDLPHRIYNVGTGVGSSVREVLDAIAAASGLDTTPIVEARRPGDPPRLVADVSRIREDLGFESTTPLKETVDSAWAAWQAGPRRIG